MHIAYFVIGWPVEKFSNGIVTYTTYMKSALEKKGHKVSIFTSRLVSEVNEPNVYVLKTRFWDKVKQYLLGYRSNLYYFSKLIADEILRLHKKDPIDIIEMEESFGWFADIAAITSLPLLTKLHGPAFLNLNSFELKTAWGIERVQREGRALEKAKSIISPCKYTLERTVEKYHLNPANTSVIVNPIEVNNQLPLWKLDGCDPNVILFIGRFDLHKGGDIILQAFLSLLQRRTNLKLVFVGQDRGLTNPDESVTFFKPYCDLLFPSELRGQVDYRGVLTPQEINFLRTKAMVTIVPSRFENYSYTFIEAMMQGCPIVCTDAGGCPELIQNGVTGLLAKSENPEDFALKIAYLLDHPMEAEAMGKAARQRVIECNSPSKVVEETLKMYEKTIAIHSGKI